MKKLLKKVLLSLGLLAMAIQFVSAQDGFSYQAVVRNANGEFMSGKDVSMRITLSHAGSDYYQELHSVTTGSNGELSLIVGRGTLLSGSFDSVPWNTMNVTMMTEICINGTDFVKLTEKKINPVPYALYAASTKPTTSIEATEDADESDALFSVKDEKGNLIFAVYPNLVKVFIDDTATSGKAMSRGFAISERKASKDGNGDIFSVNAAGTNIYIDNDSSKAMSRGFAISERKASKDDNSANLFVVDGNGTQVYVGNDSKAMSRGFAISERKASKEDASLDILTVDANGTQVFIDDENGKAMSRGFAISERKAATKESTNADLFVVDGIGTQVYVGDEAKAMSRGFAISERKASKDEFDIDYLTVNNGGTQVFVGSDGKAMSRGFAISERKATKDGADDDLFVVDNESGVHVYVDDDDNADKAMSRGFAISERKATKDGSADYVSINNGNTLFKINTNDEKPAFSVAGMTSNEQLVAINNQSFDIEKPVSAVGNTQYVDRDVECNLAMTTILDISAGTLGYSIQEYYSIPFLPWINVNKLNDYNFKIDLGSLTTVASLPFSPEKIFFEFGRDTVINYRYNEKTDNFILSADFDVGDYHYGHALIGGCFFNEVDACFNMKANAVGCDPFSVKVSNVVKYFEGGVSFGSAQTLRDSLERKLSGDYSDCGSISCSCKYGLMMNVNYYYDKSTDTEYFYRAVDENGTMRNLYRVVDGEGTVTYYMNQGTQFKKWESEETSDSKFLSAKFMIARMDSNVINNSNASVAAYTEYVADSVQNLSVLSFYQEEKSLSYNYSCLYDNGTGLIQSWCCYSAYANDGIFDNLKADVEIRDLKCNASIPDWVSGLNSQQYSDDAITEDDKGIFIDFGKLLWRVR